MTAGACACTSELVCDRHLERYRRQLGDVPAVLAELEVTASRQGRGGSLARGSSVGRPAPLPYDPAAADLRREIERAIVDGVRAIVSRQVTVAAAVGYLLEHVEAQRDHPDWVAWLDDATARARRMILGPRDRWYAGECGAPIAALSLDGSAGDVVSVSVLPAGRCETRLFASTSDATVTCRVCRAVHPVAERRAQLVADAEDRLLPMRTILDALPWLIGHSVNASTARWWRRDRKYRPARPADDDRPARPAQPFRTRQLFAHGLDIEGTELFRVGEVIALARLTVKRAEVRSGSG